MISSLIRKPLHTQYVIYRNIECLIGRNVSRAEASSGGDLLEVFSDGRVTAAAAVLGFKGQGHALRTTYILHLMGCTVYTTCHMYTYKYRVNIYVHYIITMFSHAQTTPLCLLQPRYIESSTSQVVGSSPEPRRTNA